MTGLKYPYMEGNRPVNVLWGWGALLGLVVALGLMGCGDGGGGGEADGAGGVDKALPVEEPERQLLVVAGRPHRHAQRLAADPDLQRLLDGDRVARAVALHLPVEPRAVDPAGPFRGLCVRRHGRFRATPRG